MCLSIYVEIHLGPAIAQFYGAVLDPLVSRSNIPGMHTLSLVSFKDPLIFLFVLFLTINAL